MKFKIQIAVFGVFLFFISCRATDEKASEFYYNQAEIKDKKPWTTENFRNNPDNFKFAIIGDRTGGANAQHTFKLAMNQLNLLEPEFVINVGDLIEGYSDNKDELSGEWDAMNLVLGELRMPFFRTPGNHDIANPVALTVYREKFGATYYYFIYKNTLFIVLDTEDNSRPAPPPGMKAKIELYNRLQTEDPVKAQSMLAEFMSDESVVAALAKPVAFPEYQLEWIKRTLAENTKVRWTFLFMHEPCWENPSESFKTIQELLKNRKHTFFAGHLHYYDYDNMEGVEYITMGSAGASFHHEGPGNVDHIMWVTMNENGPQMGNIALKGIYDRKGLDTSLFGAYDRKGAGK